MKAWNIFIAGVGGQGTLLTSKILGAAAQAAGLDVKVSEVHGMAQRGGSVVTYVKMARRVYSPIIEPGEADILLAFEMLEALRYADFVRPGGRILANTQQIMPMPVIMGRARYPADAADRLGTRNAALVTVDALALAKQAGSARAVNVVMIGALARCMDIDRQTWLDAIAACVPAKTLAVNISAFELGYDQLR